MATFIGGLLEICRRLSLIDPNPYTPSVTVAKVELCEAVVHSCGFFVERERLRKVLDFALACLVGKGHGIEGMR